MLEESSFQFLVPNLADCGEGQVVAGIGLVVTARCHEDPSASAMSGGDVAWVTPPFMNLNTLLRHDQSLVVLAGVASAHWPDRPSWRRDCPIPDVAFAWSDEASSSSQGWPPAFSTSASQWPMASRRMGMACAEAPAWSSTRPKVTDRHRQLKRRIELGGVAEAFDEGLKLIHRALRIALGEARPGVLPLVVGGFFREALLAHRVLQPLHPGIALAEAA